MFSLNSKFSRSLIMPEKISKDQHIEHLGKRLSPAFKIVILGLICVIAIFCRVFSVIRYESVIHEFDPWFNYRATKVLVEKGYYEFKYWIDQEAWYPLGRYSGHTLFPGLMMTAWTMHNITHFLKMPLHIREVCVFTAPIFSAFSAIVAYLLAKQVTGKSQSGFFSAIFMAVVPSYLSRSVAGSYDNEAVAIFALLFSFYTFVKAVNSGTLLHGLLAAFGYYYMVLTWGGYIFVLGLISIYVVGLIIAKRFNFKVYIAFSLVYLIGNLLSLTMPFVSIWAVWQSSEHLPSHIAFIIMQFYYITGFVRANLSKQKFEFLRRAVIRLGLLAVLSLFLYIVVMGKTTAGHRIMTLINPVYAKKHNPLVASISEHQSTPWPSFFFDLQYNLIFAPIGFFVCLKKLGNSKLFLALYGGLSVYFASVMVRLLLVTAPALCVLSGIGVSYVVEECTNSIRKGVNVLISGLTTQEEQETAPSQARSSKKKKRMIPFEIAVLGCSLIGFLCCKAIFHGTWTAAVAYSSPSIILCKKIIIFSIQNKGKKNYR